MFCRSGRGEEADEDYTKGLIVSFTAKKPEVADGANEEELTGGDEEEKLSREDIKGALCKYGTVRVSKLLYPNLRWLIVFFGLEGCCLWVQEINKY